MEYLPVSPVAPPKRTTLVLLTRVMVCPKRAIGTSPYTSSSSTALPWFPGVPVVVVLPPAGMVVVEAGAGVLPSVELERGLVELLPPPRVVVRGLY